MGSLGVVEAEVATDRGSGIGHRVIGAQVDLLVFDGSPEPLDENVVTPGALGRKVMHDEYTDLERRV